MLVNSEPGHQRLEKEMYEELGLRLSYEEQQSFVGQSAMDSWTFVINKYGLKDKPQDLLLRGRRKYLKVLLETDEVKLMDGAADLIRRLESEFHLLLASSATSVTIGEVLRKFGLVETFPIFIGGDMVVNSKPNPEIFIKVALQAGVQPEECVVIEDAEHGVTAAKKAGMKCLAVTNTHPREKLTEADLVVTTLETISVADLAELFRSARGS